MVNMLKEKFRDYQSIIHAKAEDYVNSRYLLDYERGEHHVQFDIKDVLLLCALSGTDCLLTGKTGAGKTRLSEQAMLAMFGPELGQENPKNGDQATQSGDSQGYVNKTITPSMRPQEFLDISYNKFLEGEETLQSAMQATPILKAPGVILNEANRAPSLVQNFLIPFLDRKIDIEGIHFKSGVSTDSGQYQFRIITINEGEEYETTAMDKALRDRVGLEVPMDSFYQSSGDCYQMLQNMAKSTKPDNQEQHQPRQSLPQLSAQFGSQVGIAANVWYLLLYLSGMSYCQRIAQKGVWPPVKEVAQVRPDLCKGCRYATSSTFNGEHNLCGSVHSLSQRALRQLLRLAQAVSLGAASQNDTSELVVQEEDVWAIAPLVLYKKLQFAPHWLEAHLSSEWLALREALQLIRKRWANLKQEGILECAEQVHTNCQGDQATLQQIHKYVQESRDFWALRLFSAHHLPGLDNIGSQELAI